MLKYYFISDCHLGVGTDREEDRKREQRLLAVLDRIEAEAKQGLVGGLFLVGDLFDSWFDYRQVVPRRHIRTLAVFARIRDHAPVEYLMGNHDFGHRTFFKDELQIPVHGGDITRDLGGKRFYIAHGDGKALNDTGYLILRKILRNKAALWLYSWLHPDIGIWLAERVSGGSRSYTDKRDALQKQDGLLLFAEQKVQEGYDYVVMGHRHKPQIVSIGNGYYVNLGDWLQSYTYGVFNGEIFTIEYA